jgi:hypothetical protein
VRVMRLREKKSHTVCFIVLGKINLPIILLPRSQSYQTLISSFFRFSLLSLSVCRIRKYCLCFEMAKLSREKWKKSSFYKEKSLVGLTPGLNR